MTSYVEWTLGTDREETQLHTSTYWDPEAGALFARNPFHPEFGRQVAFSALHPAPDSYSGDRTEFLGRNGSLSRPAALERQSLSGRAYPGLDPCAALQVVIELDPGEVTEIVHLVGRCGSAEEARRMVKRYRDPHRAEEALIRTRAWWDRLLEAVEVETPELSVNFLLNRWLLYQTLACRIWGRSGLYHRAGEVMERILGLDHPACQEGALHGLGHFQSGYAGAVRAAVNAYLRRRGATLPAEIRDYALSARRGCLL